MRLYPSLSWAVPAADRPTKPDPFHAGAGLLKDVILIIHIRINLRPVASD